MHGAMFDAKMVLSLESEAHSGPRKWSKWCSRSGFKHIHVIQSGPNRAFARVLSKFVSSKVLPIGAGGKWVCGAMFDPKMVLSLESEAIQALQSGPNGALARVLSCIQIMKQGRSLLVLTWYLLHSDNGARSFPPCFDTVFAAFR